MKKVLISLILMTYMFSCSKNSDENSNIVIPSVTTGTWTDTRDGKEYKTIIIGEQEWMAENLAYRLPYGTLDGVYTYKEEIADTLVVDIPKSEIHRLMLERDVNKRLTTFNIADMFFQIYSMYGFEEYFILNPRNPSAFEMSWLDMVKDKDNMMYADEEFTAYMKDIEATLRPTYILEAVVKNVDANYANEYGILYSYSAVKRSIPDGWRLPSDEDWKRLEMALGMSSDEANAVNEWRGNGQGDLLAEKKFGFDVNYGGSYVDGKFSDRVSNFQYLGYKTTFWTSSISEMPADTLSLTRSFMRSNSKIYRGTTSLRLSLNSVRLVRDKFVK